MIELRIRKLLKSTLRTKREIPAHWVIHTTLALPLVNVAKKLGFLYQCYVQYSCSKKIVFWKRNIMIPSQRMTTNLCSRQPRGSAECLYKAVFGKPLREVWVSCSYKHSCKKNALCLTAWTLWNSEKPANVWQNNVLNKIITLLVAQQNMDKVLAQKRQSVTSLHSVAFCLETKPRQEQNALLWRSTLVLAGSLLFTRQRKWLGARQLSSVAVNSNPNSRQPGTK